MRTAPHTAGPGAMNSDENAPCIVGIGRRTWRASDGDAPEPLEMCNEVAAAAAADSGQRSLLRSVDAIHAVHCASWAYDNFSTRLTDHLGLGVSYSENSMLAGTSGQRMLTHAAERMLLGQSEVALIVGAEAFATKKRLTDRGEDPRWSHPAPDHRRSSIDVSEWTSLTESAHQILAPSLTFALLDSARRAASGIEPDAYRRAQAEVLAGINAVAAGNEHAWLRTRRDAEEIATPTPQNRMISSPYTKYMVAIMNVDMAAALIMTTRRKADELGIPHDHRVYLRGWSFGRDSTHLAQRPFLDASPAMQEASSSALRHARVGIDEIDHFDLYSCFPSAVTFATDALGLKPGGDGRALSVTGGLPYHGGPSSNYTTHAIAETVDRLRRDGGNALVSGVGLHMTKHSWAVYSDRPGPVAAPDYRAVQARIDRHRPLSVCEQLAGTTGGRIAACSVTHDRAGDPISATVIVDLDDTTRAYARSTDAHTIGFVQQTEPVGLPVVLRPTGPYLHDFRVETM